MTSAPAQRADLPAASDDELPLDEAELHVEKLVPFTWRTTLYSLLVWPLPFLSILFWYVALTIADLTFWRVGKMLALPRFAARMSMWLGGVRVRVHGIDNLDRTQRYVFAGNHVSMFDAPVAAAGAVINARAFQEKSHLDIPVYGGFVKIFDEVLIDWKDADSRARAYTEALRRIASGWSFGVFPEGSRSYDGKLGAFYDGAFRLAIEAGVPILPACFSGLRNICPPGEWRVRPGVAHVIYGEPIPTDGMTLDPACVERLKNRTRRAINDLLRAGPPPTAP